MENVVENKEALETIVNVSAKVQEEAKKALKESGLEATNENVAALGNIFAKAAEKGKDLSESDLAAVSGVGAGKTALKYGLALTALTGAFVGGVYTSEKVKPTLEKGVGAVVDGTKAGYEKVKGMFPPKK